MTPTIISRRDAANGGHNKFFTGKPCKYGHVALRYVTTGGCVDCGRAAAQQFNAKVRGTVAVTRPGQLTVQVHPDDWDAVYALVDYLNAQRGIKPTERQPAPPPTDTRTRWEQLYDMHCRARPEHLARALATRQAGPETHSEGWRPTVSMVSDAPASTGGATPEYLR